MKKTSFFTGLFFGIATGMFFCPGSEAKTPGIVHRTSGKKTELKTTQGERIFFIRKRNVGGLWLGDIYSMKPDGTDVQRITNLSDDYFITEQVQISGDGRSMSFISNYESWKSAFYTDAFIFDLQSGSMRRVTGYEQKTPVTEFATVTVTVEDPKNWAISPSAIRISHKGCSNFVTGNSAVLIVPANEDIWVKAELAKAKGDLKVVNVPSGGSATLAMSLEAGSLSAEHVCPSSSGSLLAVATNNENVNFPFYTIAIWGTNEGNILAEVKGQRLGGDTYPAFSPDGSMLAFCTGQHTLNSLAVVPTDHLDGTPKVLAQGSSFGIQAFCSQPAWSPDGSEIVYVYTTIATSFMGTEIQSNLYMVSVNGGDPVQVTSYSGNSVVSRPSFSPDGNSIAFTLSKSSGDVFLLSDLINNTYTSNIYALSLRQAKSAGGVAAPVALTNDGRSLDPSWGLVSSGVGVPEQQGSPDSFQLFRSYPNPFHDATNIEYEIREQTRVTITVYDLHGRLVSVLVDEIQPAGKHRTMWTGTDHSGRYLPGGIYLCRIMTDGFSIGRSMVLQR